MFETIEAAVTAHRSAAIDHHRAREQRDNATMDDAIRRIQDVEGFLRARGRPELIQPLLMEWITEGGDAAEHARYRALVNHLVGR